ncbi:sugar transferase [Anaerolineales bacterium]
MAGHATSIHERPSVEPRWLLPIVDVILSILSFYLAYLLRYELQLIRPILDPIRRDFSPYIPFAVFYALILLLIYSGGGLYRNIRTRSWLEEVIIITNGAAVAIVILLALFFVLQPLVTSRLMLVYVPVISISLLSFARLIRRWSLSILRDRGIGVERVLIIGMGEVGQSVLRVMLARKDLGFDVIGYLDDNPNIGEKDLGRVKGFGAIESLREKLSDNRIDMVVLTLAWTDYERLQQTVNVCLRNGIAVRVVPDIFQLNMRQVQFENFDGVPLLGISPQVLFTGRNRLLKRAMDIGLTLLAAPLWLLILLLTAIAIKLEDGGSIFFSQVRIGENGREFKMIKFRSMIPNAEAHLDAVISSTGQDPLHPKPSQDDDWRITRVGRVIRKTSIDELPNLINVLRGEMSLVGPRPAVPREVMLYETWHRRRLNIIPGITGLWQVSGRSDVPFEEMVLLDIYYVENWSLMLDLQILLRTIPKVLFRQGAR